MSPDEIQRLLETARQGITTYLDDARRDGRIDEQQYRSAAQNTFPALEHWMTTPRYTEVCPALREGVRRTVDAGEWEQLVNAYRQSCRFGTGGIRGMMAFDRESIRRLKDEGFSAPILRGPNTINEIVLLRTSAGVAKFGLGQDPPFAKVVIGYDSRVRGQDFAALVAQLFLAYGYTVYLFDEPCPYPEVTYAIPSELIKADVGILLSASHNDYRYNGYKLSCSNGSQFDPEQRDEMYERYIANVTPQDIRLLSFEKAPREKLVFLGGDRPVPGVNYYGREDRILNIHERHVNHVKRFLMFDRLAESQQRDPLRIAYCAYHGAGRKAVPRLLTESGFRDINIIHENGLYELNGLFPSFPSDPGKERQPDPGDERAARTAIEAYNREYGRQQLSAPDAASVRVTFEDRELFIGTDPDADRCGVVVPVPENQRHLYGHKSWTLLPADDVWAVLLWYRFQQETARHGAVQDADRRFIVLSHTTSEALIRLASKYGLGSIKTWVGFAALSAAVRDVWENKPLPDLTEGRRSPKDALCHPFVCEYYDMDSRQRSINVAAMEQSNGFSLLGGPPPDNRSLGTDGHVRDKDGTLAALLVAEIAAWAKSQGTTLIELIDRQIALDPDVGLFITHYEPDPLDGEYPGIEGDRKKIAILQRALELYRAAQSGDVEIAGQRVTGTALYRTGKYDAIYPPSADFVFPDEGARFYFGDKLNHLTVRPSGTGNSLRFHVQLQSPVTEADLIPRKQELMARAKAITDDIRELLGAPRK